VVKLLLTSPRLCVSVVKIRLPACSVIRDWQRQHGFASLAIIAVGELQHTAVGFCDLASQDQSNAAAAVRGGEEWDKKIVAVEQAGALVADEDFNAARVGAPVHFHGAGMFERGITSPAGGLDRIGDPLVFAR
jgi:hypothetical protein